MHRLTSGFNSAAVALATFGHGESRKIPPDIDAMLNTISLKPAAAAYLEARRSGQERQELIRIEAGLSKKTGRAHWERSPAALKAEALPFPFRPDRVACVLAFPRDRCPAPELPAQSMNAPMKYLRRGNIVRIQSEARWASCALTAVGYGMLTAMRSSRVQ